MLPSSERLRKASLFQRTYAERKSVASDIVTLYVLSRLPRSAPQMPHVGFVIAKKVEKLATRRNLAKRRVREAYRLTRCNDAGLKQWYAMVWVIHNKALTASWEEISEAVSYCLSKANDKFGRKEARAKKPPEDPLARQGQ